MNMVIGLNKKIVSKNLVNVCVFMLENEAALQNAIDNIRLNTDLGDVSDDELTFHTHEMARLLVKGKRGDVEFFDYVVGRVIGQLEFQLEYNQTSIPVNLLYAVTVVLTAYDYITQIQQAV